MSRQLDRRRERHLYIWTFDLENDRYYIPLGIGGGKVWKAGSTIMNAPIEPQWTVAHDGDGLPQFAVFAGINMTLQQIASANGWFGNTRLVTMFQMTTIS